MFFIFTPPWLARFFLRPKKSKHQIGTWRDDSLAQLAEAYAQTFFLRTIFDLRTTMLPLAPFVVK